MPAVPGHAIARHSLYSLPPLALAGFNQLDQGDIDRNGPAAGAEAEGIAHVVARQNHRAGRRQNHRAARRENHRAARREDSEQIDQAMSFRASSSGC